MTGFRLLPAACTIAFLSFQAGAQTLYKCTVNGKPSFQDQPCAGASSGQVLSVRPAAGQAGLQAPASGTSTPKGADTVRDRLLRQADTAARERRVREIDYEIEKRERQIVDSDDATKAKVARLQLDMRSANNNLAGATWLNSLATEINAAQTAHQTLVSELRAQIADLRAERAGLQR